MKKENAIKIIVNCAKDYHTYLENQNLLFLFGSPQNPHFFEAVFLPRNFLHLTGVNITENRFSCSSDFYKKALKGVLSLDDFSLAKNGTTELKLLVLPQLMKIHRSAKMIGDYSFTKSVLYTEKLAGNISACLGFVRDDKYYIPNTALKEDIRDISVTPQQRILAILKKPITQKTYQEICYTAKNLTLKDISLNEEILSIISVKDFQRKTELSETQLQKNLSIKERITTAQTKAEQFNRQVSEQQNHPDKSVPKQEKQHF